MVGARPEGEQPVLGPGGGDRSLVLVFVDDGVGVPDADKERIFERGFGKNTGLGLFLSREILAITGMTISERGRAGQGVRFEIEVPGSGYRIDDGIVIEKERLGAVAASSL